MTVRIAIFLDPSAFFGTYVVELPTSRLLDRVAKVLFQLRKIPVCPLSGQYRERACKEERRIVCSYETLVLDRDRGGRDIPAIDHQFGRFLECIFSKVACGERSGFAGQQGQVVVLP